MAKGFRIGALPRRPSIYEIGAKYGLSSEQVRELEMQALEIAKNYLEDAKRREKEDKRKIGKSKKRAAKRSKSKTKTKAKKELSAKTRSKVSPSGRSSKATIAILRWPKR